MRVIVLSVPSTLTVTGPVLESYPTYSSGTTYALGDRVLATDTGTGFKYIYESAQASNVGHVLDDGAWWILVSAANPYRMFDQVASSQTTSATGSIVTNFTTNSITNTVSLLDVMGSSVTVNVVSGGSLVYTKTITLTSAGDNVTNWYQYFFSDLAQRNDALFTDLPSYAGATIQVTVTGTGTAAVGTLAFGNGYDLGETTEITVGIDDYSRVQADSFGNYQIVKRPFAKNGSFASGFPVDRFDEIAGFLPSLRATPAIWIGEDDSSASHVFGFYSSYKVRKQDPLGLLTIDIKGLV